MKSILKLTAILAALIAGSCVAPPPAFAQSAPPVSQIAISKTAAKTLDSLAVAVRAR